MGIVARVRVVVSNTVWTILPLMFKFRSGCTTYISVTLGTPPDSHDDRNFSFW